MSEFCKNIELHLNQSLPVLDTINVNASSFLGVCRKIEILELDSATEAMYSRPMPLIGQYIAVALCFCVGVMLADILMVGIYMKKFWVPMKLFSLNAASLTVIAVAMKLPMDLTSPMPDERDQVAKIGGLAFLCVMMSNLMPSLAIMDNKSLVSNVTALFILVITLVVNVGIQIETRVIKRVSYHPFSMPPFIAAYIYMGMLLLLLIIYISSAVTIPTLKKVIELKYQATLNDQNLQENQTFKVKELRQLVKRLWIMVETSSPQFVLATTPLSSAFNVICAFSMVVYISSAWHALARKETKSVYKDAISLIYALQSVGVVGGSVGSIYRCFAVLKFKSFVNHGRKHYFVFKLEKYWTRKLYEWKEKPLTLFSLVQINYRLNNYILSVCIIFQKVIVVLCKIIELIPIAVIIFVTYCSHYFKSLKALLFAPPTANSSNEDTNEGLSSYVLLLDDDLKLANSPVKRILESMNKFIAIVDPGTNQHNNLLKLVEKSVAFEGVQTFDIDQIQSLLPIELVNSWSLPIVSLTCIAMAIPSIDKDVVDNLLKSVDEGLFFTRRVEATLNTASERVNIRKATMTLWCEVRDKHKWLDTTLKPSAYKEKTPTEIITLFSYSSEKIMSEFNTKTNGEPVKNSENLPMKIIAANSMYRIAQTILFRYESNNLEIIEDELFTQLSNMIADILAACLSNIPQVIIMKCRESVIEKREDSVEYAIRLLAWASTIIETLETRELPNMDPEKMGFIDEWRLHLNDHP